MFGIEIKEIRIYSFNYFAIDLSNSGNFSMGGKKFTLGELSRDITNLSKDYVTDLLMLSGELNLTRRQLYFMPGYDQTLFETARDQIYNIIDFIKLERPFCYFDIKDSLRIIDTVFGDDLLNDYEALIAGTLPAKTKDEQKHLWDTQKKIKLANDLICIYCYLGNDVANFGTLAISFTETFMQTASRTQIDLATYAYGFFRNEEILIKMMEANLNKDFEGVTLRPRVTQVPIIAYDNERDIPIIASRLYFGRMMDFFVTELFEAMMRGHYLWRCKVCGRYFLMTSAHRQFYCGHFNPQYGTTCDHVANNRRLGRDKGLQKQKRKDNPLWVIRNKRYNSIRKNKSIGKYDEAITDTAKKILDKRFERAEIDPDYADNYYVDDIRLEKIYAEAEKRLGR